jgi:rhodanese-related sulfurtransferase
MRRYRGRSPKAVGTCPRTAGYSPGFEKKKGVVTAGSERLTADDLLAAARSGIARIAPVPAAAAMDEGAILVDTRCEEDRRRHGVVPGSIPVPRTVLEWRADPSSPHRDDRIADLDARLIVMCTDGYSSSLAVANLTAMGFRRAADLDGGFVAWKAAGLPVEALTD